MSDRQYIDFRSEEVHQAVFKWWTGLDKDRGARAQLRRCKNLEEVAFIPAFHHLRMDLEKLGSVSVERVAAMSGALAHVKENSPGRKFAQQLAGAGQGGDKAPMSGLRFRRLIQNKSHEDLFRDIIRAIHLVGGRANIKDLAGIIYWWNDNTRKNMAYTYYETAPKEI